MRLRECAMGKDYVIFHRVPAKETQKARAVGPQR